MFDEYFDDYEVRSDFSKEYVSLWPAWLGPNRLHLLDEVSEREWSRFNALISTLSRKFRVGIANCESRVVDFPADIRPLLSSHGDAMAKDQAQFSKFVIPDLHCLVTEEWDYTYIIWHKNNGALDALKPHILSSKLHHFSD